MVILDVQLWDLGTQRLHQGLSETILVDVREFKNNNNNKRVLFSIYQTKVSINLYLWSDFKTL